MKEREESYRRILRSSSIIGGASFVNIVIGLARTKVLALLLGPMGVGVVSLYRGLLTSASTVATMGLDTVGTRQVAEAASRQDDRAIVVARRSLFWGTAMLACIGALVLWCFRGFLARHVLGNPAEENAVGWLGVGVALSVASASQGALIQGMRRIGDLARLGIFGAVLNTILGIALLWHWGKAGLVGYVLLVPLASFVLGHLYVSRLPRVKQYRVSFGEMAGQWKEMSRIGVAFMGAGVAMSLVQLWIRVDIGKTLGTAALGQFQAAWTISTQYIVIALGAMGADYYPRLTGIIKDREAATRLVNQQTEIALLLSAPIFLVMMGLSPWVLRLLYTKEFVPVAGILRWQILSDVLKVASWPLGFVILAKGDGKLFFLTECFFLVLLAGLITGFLRLVGLNVTGMSFLASYGLYLPLVYWIARSRIGFRWSASVVRLLATVFALCAGVGILCSLSPWGGLLGAVLALVFGLFSLGRLAHMSGMGGMPGRVGAIARKVSRKSAWGLYTPAEDQ